MAHLVGSMGSLSIDSHQSAAPSASGSVGQGHPRAHSRGQGIRQSGAMGDAAPNGGLTAARHLCQEARVVLTSLRGGPPNVARGDLAQDLMDLRQLVKHCLGDPSLLTAPPPTMVNANTAQNVMPPQSHFDPSQPTAAPSVASTTTATATDSETMPPSTVDDEEVLDEDGAVLVQQREAMHLQQQAAHDMRVGDAQRPHPVHLPHHYVSPAGSPSHGQPSHLNAPHQTPQDAGPFARPFLSVIMDPRAAGPHTLVALRALYRLLERSSLQPSNRVMPPMPPSTPSASPSLQPPSPSPLLKRTSSTASAKPLAFPCQLEALAKGVLSCKFEQTDAGADEAVEMAIADLLALLVRLDRRSILPTTLMDAFNTVFITRNTFVHSPALCYHFEDVLTSMVVSVFADIRDKSQRDVTARLILEFLVNQLLHTPMLSGDDEASRDAQLAHDATRVLCLRLTRCALRHIFTDVDDDVLEAAAATPVPSTTVAAVQNADGGTESNADQDAAVSIEDRSLLQIVQDDLCLALLMTGQAIWMNHDNPSMSPGFISLEVLSEICSTLSTLWTTASLRKYLVSQFETIFTGFYQRALVLLRRRTVPQDSLTFHANMVFDAGMEVILESLVDILSLHDHKHNIAEGDGGAIERLFVTYDCNLKRSDVAVGLFMELCRCTGSSVDEEGDRIEPSVHGDAVVNADKAVVRALQSGAAGVASDGNNPAPTAAGAADKANAVGASLPPSGTPSSAPPTVNTDLPPGPDGAAASQHRQVPPHLKELCAEAIIGGMKCMFQDDHPSEQTRIERMQRQSILPDHMEEAPSSLSQTEMLKKAQGSHQLRAIKSQKRLMRRAAQLFNKKATKGIAFLVSSGLIADPPTPRSVASFLRNGIVVGLAKEAVGAYLGESGKKPQSGKSPPTWERDFFHKEALEAYCSLFRFEGQSLLDGLRMFLASFRLPGESQQIDRILQNFAESCVTACEETKQGLFSSDPKRASDAAYLLSFSIIMLNTDQHNENIREDRKMSKKDFVRNNTNYGRDIMEPGEEFPREYLEAIYDSIRLEQIRTEGEGADGSMTVERWKDVMRGSTEDENTSNMQPSEHDAEDLSELVLEHVWMPIMSSVAALWNVNKAIDFGQPLSPSNEGNVSGMLGAQGARLGMDMALEMLLGVRKLSRNDIFRKMFKCVCHFTGLLDYTSDGTQRGWAFSNSVECQSAFLAAFKIAREAGDEIGQEGWKMVWSMIFELRDLRMLGGGVATRAKSILMESDPDLLREDARKIWTVKLLKGGREDAMQDDSASMGVSSIFGSVGRALFGSTEQPMATDPSETVFRDPAEKTVHGKEELYVWDDLSPSDDEDEGEDGEETEYLTRGNGHMTVGARFESQLVHEDMLINQRRETPVTGLERADETQSMMLSPRARSRKRVARACNFSGIVSDTRFMDVDGIGNVLYALVSLIQGACAQRKSGNRGKQAAGSSMPVSATTPLSPASEAFAEVLICEIALRNRDRLTLLWQQHLRRHYVSRLEVLCKLVPEADKAKMLPMDAGLEKCITGLLRICCCAVQREGVSSDILSVFTALDPSKEVDGASMYALASLDGHLGEGLWRIARNIDEGTKLSSHGWEGLLSLVMWCTYRGSLLEPIHSGIGRSVGLAENDPALQAYRTLHYIVNVSEVKEEVPPSVVNSIRVLIMAGDRRRCPKLAIAALDLLQAVNGKVGFINNGKEMRSAHDSLWLTCWRPVVETLATTAELNSYSSVRQHALSILADSFLDKRGAAIPVEHLSTVLVEVCIPLAGRRIVQMKQSPQSSGSYDEIMIELELCVGLIFKPLRHHMKTVIAEDSSVLLALWKSVLTVLKQVLSGTSAGGAEDGQPSAGTDGAVTKAATELALEHLRNVILVLIEMNALTGPSPSANELSTLTWTTVEGLDACKPLVAEWKSAAEANVSN